MHSRFPGKDFAFPTFPEYLGGKITIPNFPGKIGSIPGIPEIPGAPIPPPSGQRTHPLGEISGISTESLELH